MVEILRTCKWTGITEFAKAGVPEIFPSAPAQPLPSPSSSSSPSSSGPQGHTTTDLEAANAVPDDGIVWWKADDPTLNEGVDPPPVEKSPFKIAPALERNIEGRKGQFGGQNGQVEGQNGPFGGQKSRTYSHGH